MPSSSSFYYGTYTFPSDIYESSRDNNNNKENGSKLRTGTNTKKIKDESIQVEADTEEASPVAEEESSPVVLEADTSSASLLASTFSTCSLSYSLEDSSSPLSTHSTDSSISSKSTRINSSLPSLQMLLIDDDDDEEEEVLEERGDKNIVDNNNSKSNSESETTTAGTSTSTSTSTRRRTVRWSSEIVIKTVPRLSWEEIDEMFYSDEELDEMRHNSWLMECGLMSNADSTDDEDDSQSWWDSYMNSQL